MTKREKLVEKVIQKIMECAHDDEDEYANAIIDLIEQDRLSEINSLREALVYVAFASHATPLYELPKGIILGGNDTVEVKLNSGATVIAKFPQPPEVK